MKGDRLTIRLGPSYQHWIAQIGGDESNATRALIALGAATLGLEGAAQEAVRLMGVRLDRSTLLNLLEVADERQTSVRQASDKRQTGGGRVADEDHGPVPTVADLLGQADDPLDDIGIAV